MVLYVTPDRRGGWPKLWLAEAVSGRSGVKPNPCMTEELAGRDAVWPKQLETALDRNSVRPKPCLAEVVSGSLAAAGLASLIGLDRCGLAWWFGWLGRLM